MDILGANQTSAIPIAECNGIHCILSGSKYELVIVHKDCSFSWAHYNVFDLIFIYWPVSLTIPNSQET